MTACTLPDSCLEALATARIELARRTAAVVEPLGLVPSQILELMFMPDLADASDSLASLDRAVMPTAHDPALPGGADFYWRRFVREARALAFGGHATGTAKAGPVRAEVSSTQGPLWGSQRYQQQFAFRYTSVPEELHAAAPALGDALRSAVTTQEPGRRPIADASDLESRQARDVRGRSAADPPPACARVVAGKSPRSGGG